MEQWRKDARREAVITDLEALVPKEHLLRKIEKVMDYEWLYERLDPYYCHDNGRPGTAQFASTDCPFRMSGAGNSVEANWALDCLQYVNTEINTDVLFAKSLKFNLFRFLSVKAYGRNSALSVVQDFVRTPFTLQSFTPRAPYIQQNFKIPNSNGKRKTSPRLELRVRA